MTFSGCPLNGVTDDAWEALTIFAMADENRPPASGGYFDQTDAFWKAYGLRNAIKARLAHQKHAQQR